MFLCVCLLALSRLNRLSYGPKIWYKGRHTIVFNDFEALLGKNTEKEGTAREGASFSCSPGIAGLLTNTGTQAVGNDKDLEMFLWKSAYKPN